MYRNATDFCILILYLTTLLNSFLFLTVSLVESSGFSIYNIMSSANSDNFTSSFSIWMHFFFPCLIAPGRTSNTMLNKSGGSGNHCFIPDIRGQAFRFSPLSMMLSVVLLYMAFIMLRYIPSILTCLEFWILILSNPDGHQSQMIKAAAVKKKNKIGCQNKRPDEYKSSPLGDTGSPEHSKERTQGWHLLVSIPKENSSRP